MTEKLPKPATPFESLLRGLKLMPEDVASSDWEAWRQALADLDARDRSILEGRHGLAGGPRQTLSALGARVGITHERVRQLQERALRRLRRHAVEKGLVREEAPDRLSPSREEPFRPEAPVKRKALVLVVDDNRMFLEIVDRYLKQAGFECALAEGGGAAAVESGRRVPDAVLLEPALRDIDGFALLRAWRANFRTKDVPIVFVTGNPDADLLESAGRLAGAFAFLRKPIDFDQLARTLKAAVGFPLDDEEQAIRLPTLVNGPGFQIDIAACELLVEGRVESLEPKERDILLTLIRRPGRLWPTEALRMEVWGVRDPGYNTLATRISALRRKLGGLGPRLQNVRKWGYRFAA